MSSNWRNLIKDPRRPTTGETEVALGMIRLERHGPPPRFISRRVHRLGKSAPLDVSMPCFADLASAWRVGN
jgi:hypothetical protein